MNIPRLPFVVLILACAFLSGLMAQNAQTSDAYFASTLEIVRTTSAPAAYRQPNKISQTFTGYAIEIATARYPLQNNANIFRQFGNVFYQKLKEGGYSYLITMNFSSEDSAWSFIDSVVLPKAPGAILYQYKEGHRKHLQR